MGYKETLEVRQANWDTSINRKYREIDDMRKKRILSDEIPSIGIREFYRGKTILVTGGTGFIGKVLIEKLLRTIPDLEKIYAIVRPKRGGTPADRMNAVLQKDLFDLVRAQDPNALKKVIAIEGDMSLKGLGLSEWDRHRLTNEVSIVFHGAATVRFDDPLKNALLLNTRGTNEMVELSKCMKNMQSFVYISTAFANTDQKITLEKVYPNPIDWRHMIKLAETTSLEDLQAICSKVLGFQPNTYTFTKQLSEKIVDDARYDIPVTIIRPAVVTAVIKDPIPGWTETLYGPFGFGLGLLKGVTRVLYLKNDVSLNRIPVDSTIDILLSAAWLRGTNTRLSDDSQSTDVVHITTSEVCCETYEDMGQTMMLLRKTLNARRIRAPRCAMTDNYWYYSYRNFTSHILFGLFIDALLWLSGQKLRLLKAYRTLYNVNKALSYFMMHKFAQKSENLWKLMSYTTDPDYQATIHFDLREYIYNQTKYYITQIEKEELGDRWRSQFFEVLYYVQQLIKYTIFIWLGSKLALFLLNRFTTY